MQREYFELSLKHVNEHKITCLEIYLGGCKYTSVLDVSAHI